MINGVTVTIDSRDWVVSVAQSLPELQQGLSGVASIPAQTGKLFDLGSDKLVTVNAYDMLFPIDVVFIGADMKVTEIAPNLVPGPTSAVTSTIPARYFLEMNAGEYTGLSHDDVVTFAGYTPGILLGGINLGEIMNLMITLMMVSMMMKMMTGAIKQIK